MPLHSDPTDNAIWCPQNAHPFVSLSMFSDPTLVHSYWFILPAHIHVPSSPLFPLFPMLPMVPQYTQRCLTRDQAKRPSVEELCNDPYMSKKMS